MTETIVLKIKTKIKIDNKYLKSILSKYLKIKEFVFCEFAIKKFINGSNKEKKNNSRNAKSIIKITTANSFFF